MRSCSTVIFDFPMSSWVERFISLSSVMPERSENSYGSVRSTKHILWVQPGTSRVSLNIEGPQKLNSARWLFHSQ